MEIDKDALNIIAKEVFERAAELSPLERQRSALESLNAMIFNILIFPQFTEVEYGILIGNLSVRMVLSSGLKSYEESQSEMKEITEAYHNLFNGQPVSDKIKNYMSYYATFANIAGGD